MLPTCWQKEYNGLLKQFGISVVSVGTVTEICQLTGGKMAVGTGEGNEGVRA